MVHPGKMKKNKKESKQRISYLNTAPKRRLAAAVLSIAGVWAFPWMLHIGGGWLGYTNSILTVFLFLGLFFLMDKVLQSSFLGKGSRWFWPGCVGTVFSVCMTFGARLDLEESVPFRNGLMWMGILVQSVIFTLLTRYFWDLSGHFGSEKKEAARQEPKVQPKSFFFTAGVILLCYIPVFLAVYPGFFVYDAQDEYLQVVTRNFTTHHPLMHVLLLGGIIQLIFKLTGSYNLGIACYTILQMTLMSGIFAWCVEKIKSRGMGKGGRILLTLYFGLCPVLVMFSLCSAKDGLFTGMLLIMVLLFQELCRDPEVFFKQRGNVILLAAASMGMMLLRHNGFYAFLVFVPVLALYLKKWRKKVLFYLAGILAGYFLVNAALTALLHADDSENQEMLTVPISQMARVYADEKDTLPAEEKEILYRYLSEETLARYTPKVSDGVKINFNNEAFAEDKGSFLKLWAKWGIEHPFTYINGWFMTSYGFWYPDTVIDVYRGNTVFTFTYGDSSYFGYEVEQPGTRESKLPWLNELYRRMSLEIAQQKIPVLSMLFSPGFLFWVMAFILGYFCYQKEFGRVLPFVLPLLCWLTVILGPTYLVRYVVFLWVALPLLLWELRSYFTQVGKESAQNR